MISAGMLFLCAIGLGWTVGVKDEAPTHRWPGESLEQFVTRVEMTGQQVIAELREEAPDEQRSNRTASAIYG